MNRKLVSAIVLMFFLAGLSSSVAKVPRVKASVAVYINADGSVDPPTTPIRRVAAVYYFVDNINASIIVHKDNIVIDGDGYTLQGMGTGYGIDLNRRNNVTVRNVWIEDFLFGIYLGRYSGRYFGNTLAGNVIRNCSWSAIYLASYDKDLGAASSNNRVFDNIIENNTSGIGLGRRSYGNTLYNNTITDNTNGLLLGWETSMNNVSNNIISDNERGLDLGRSHNNFLSGNIMNNNGVNFGISGNAQAYFQHSIDTSNLVNGKPVYYLIGQENMIITPSTYPQIGFLALVDCVNIRVENLVLTDICNLQGILLASTNNSTLANNLVENNQEGIALYLSSDNTISNNIATNSYVGVKLDSSSDNTVVGNTLKDNNLGIELSTTASFSTNNTIFDNNIKTSDVGISLNSGGNDVIHNTLANITSTGIAVGSDSSENDISNNTVRSEAYGIYLGGLPAKRPISNTISGNDIAINGATSARAGITLGYSDRNTISQNTIVFLKSTYTTSQGIRIVSSLDNIIFNNTVANSGWRGAGISLQAESSGNVIFHNDFVDNPTQAYSSEDSISSWDNGYPSGGNYWSDYIGIDEKSGSKQDQTGSDGIGDTPYVIDERNRDRYPLMHPSSFTPWVLVTSPNGGEKWLVGSFQCICWADLGVSSNVSIDLSIDSGTTWEETLFANTVANGIKSCRVIAYPGDSLRVRVTSLEVPVVSDTSDSDFSITTVSTTNTLPEGDCTWWAYERRAQLAMPVDWLNDMPDPCDAWKWIDFARQAGVPTGSEPKQGAIAVWGTTATNSHGHVAVVEWVDEIEGFFSISEMNYGSFIDLEEGITVNFRKVTERGFTLPWLPGEDFLGFIYSRTNVFNVLVEEENYPVVVLGNSTVTEFEFDQTLAQISLVVSSETGTVGYCNVTIPNTLLGGPYIVLVNDLPVSPDPIWISNDTHSSIYFTYHHSIHVIKIIGATVIPELPSFLIPPIFIIATLLVVIIYRRKYSV